MALSYEYSVGSVKAKETSLLTVQDLENMLFAKTEKELLSILKDKNYGVGETINEVLAENQKKSWEYISSIIPENKLFDCFFYPNDVHNIKSVMKGTLAQSEYKNLFIFPATISVNIIESAVNEGKFSALPEWISASADKAFDIIAHTNDARLADAFLDRACMAEMLNASEKTSSKFLAEYIKQIVFYNNIKIALRGSRTNAPIEYYNNALCVTDGFDYSTLKSEAVKGENALLEFLSAKSDYNCSQAVEKYKKSPAEFERFTDDELMKKARNICKTSSEGADSVIGYYLAKEAENKAVHIIASGIATRTMPEKIRERLRKIYA